MFMNLFAFKLLYVFMCSKMHVRLKFMFVFMFMFTACSCCTNTKMNTNMDMDTDMNMDNRQLGHRGYSYGSRWPIGCMDG
jgi:hypothetical protein